MKADTLFPSAPAYLAQDYRGMKGSGLSDKSMEALVQAIDALSIIVGHENTHEVTRGARRALGVVRGGCVIQASLGALQEWMGVGDDIDVTHALDKDLFNDIFRRKEVSK